MIRIEPDINLGLDKSRIKDPSDAERQHITVEEILKRMFAHKGKDRWELQILADEVGLGKTFVALGVAYSLLAHLRNGNCHPDLEGCYQKVLVITPHNSALFAKWRREVSEFVKRCVVESVRVEAAKWFSPIVIDRLDDLAVELRRPGKGPRVLVTHMGIFGGGKLVNYDLKRRFLLGALFRFWGTRFRFDARERLLKGAPADWPRDPSSLTMFTEEEEDTLHFKEDEIVNALERLSPQVDYIEKLLEECIAVAEPFTRSRDELFQSIGTNLISLYRIIATSLIGKDLPLVIVDEAHNWKNGPTSGTNGYYTFRDTIACRARRALLLTATPFQLRPEEILELLKVSDHLATCPTIAGSEPRRERLKRHREDTVKRVLKNSADASRRFSQAWSRLPSNVTTSEIEALWIDSTLEKARRVLREMAGGDVSQDREVFAVVQRTTHDMDPTLREFVREALFVFAYNCALSMTMSPLVIRHRRETRHRAYMVGREYGKNAELPTGPNSHLLHAAPGLDVQGEGELPHYLLMRCISELKQGKGRSSLGSALTGCYSTLLDSAEGKSIQSRLHDSAIGSVYLDLLGNLVNESQDPNHPKLREVVDAVIRAWRSGEKTLIFCFRVNTAKRLRDILDKKIRNEMTARRKMCLGGEEALKGLRGRLTGRDRDLVGLCLDRVLWSYLCASPPNKAPFTAKHLELTEGDFTALAHVALRHEINLVEDRIDRVFLNRAIEHVVATRIMAQIQPTDWWEKLLCQIGNEAWVTYPYGQGVDTDVDDGGEERPDFDERGANTIYRVRREQVSKEAVIALASRLRERWQRGRIIAESAGVFESYVGGPSLWLGPDPRLQAPRTSATIRVLHNHLAELCNSADGKAFDWNARRLLFQALRRAVLRESVLLRLLPDKADREERQWGELLAERFFASLPGQHESMADRVAVFLEDLCAASGSITEIGSARHNLFDATRLNDQQFVALVAGGKDERSRERVFAGFNSPLLPEVLVCTSVGQEGIDLHRHCRRIVHYDLAWNPAVLEQRTGRADRIGSKTFRERSRPVADGPGPYLEIGVPFLAGTYDERMYEELRLRAQTFEGFDWR
ncbi:MAG: helicase-related protein [Nitrospira sp.]